MVKKWNTYCQSLGQFGSKFVPDNCHNVLQWYISKANFQIGFPSSEQIQSISKRDLTSEWNRENKQYLSFWNSPKSSDVLNSNKILPVRNSLIPAGQKQNKNKNKKTGRGNQFVLLKTKQLALGTSGSPKCVHFIVDVLKNNYNPSRDALFLLNSWIYKL